jgi:hypothetical protein
VLYFGFLDSGEPDPTELSYEARTGSRFLPRNRSFRTGLPRGLSAA